MQSNQIELDSLVTGRYRLDETAAAFAAAAEPASIKVIIDVTEPEV